MSALSAASHEEEYREIMGLRDRIDHLTLQGSVLQAENDRLKLAIKKLHQAKGRYHTQLALCDLFDLMGLPNERPTK